MPARRTILLLLPVVLLTSGCGKKGPMLYPDMLVAQAPQQISVEQSGAALRLSFDLPTKDLAGRKLEDLEAVVIARRVYRNGGCISCQDQYQDLQKIDLAFPAPAQRLENRIIWDDSDVRVGERYQYRLQAIQKGGVSGSAVNSELVGVQQSPPTPVIKADSVFGGLIVISLVGIPAQEAQLAGFRIYRADGENSEFQLLASLGGDKRQYEDQSVQRGIIYSYAAKVLVMRADGIVAESNRSETVTARVTDDPK